MQFMDDYAESLGIIFIYLQARIKQQYFMMQLYVH